jgi:hypothetical protein
MYVEDEDMGVLVSRLRSNEHEIDIATKDVLSMTFDI